MTHNRREMVQIAGLGIFGLGVLQGDHAPRKQVISKLPAGTTTPAGAGAIRSGHLLFLSGMRAPSGNGDIRTQTAAALAVMSAFLKAAGASMADLLQVQVALVDPERNWEPMTDAYNSLVPEPRPVRSYFGVTGFDTRSHLVQFDAIAYVA